MGTPWLPHNQAKSRLPAHDRAMPSIKGNLLSIINRMLMLNYWMMLYIVFIYFALLPSVVLSQNLTYLLSFL